MRDLELLWKKLEARTAELTRQMEEMDVSRGTTSELIARIADLKARTERRLSPPSNSSSAPDESADRFRVD
jgi:hypothetical protein